MRAGYRDCALTPSSGPVWVDPRGHSTWAFAWLHAQWEEGSQAGDAESRVEEQGFGWAGFLKLDGAREAGLGDTRRSAILIKMGLGWAWGHSVDLGDLESHDRAACRNQS